MSSRQSLDLTEARLAWLADLLVQAATVGRAVDLYGPRAYHGLGLRATGAVAMLVTSMPSSVAAALVDAVCAGNYDLVGDEPEPVATRWLLRTLEAAR